MNENFRIQCRTCHAGIIAKPHHIGKTVSCPKCKSPIEVREPMVPAQVVTKALAPPPPVVHEASRVEQTDSASFLTRERSAVSEGGQRTVVATQVVVQSKTSQLGIAGFVVSILGLFSCGFLSPVGLILSLIALTKAPRGMAVAGSILGAFGIIPLLLLAIPFAIAMIAIPTAADSIRKEIAKQEVVRNEIEADKKTKAQESLEILKGVVVSNGKIVTTENRITGSSSSIEFELTNQLTIPIRKFYCFIVSKEPGRSIPIIEDSFSHEPPGGLEPNETKLFKLAPNMFSDIGKAKIPMDAETTIVVYRVDGADSKAAYEAEDLLKNELGFVK